MRAIDQGAGYEVDDGLGDLSILDESFLNRLDMPALDGLPLTKNILQPNDTKNKSAHPVGGRVLPDDKGDAELWQTLLVEQKKRYEEAIRKLRDELATVKGQLPETKQERGDQFERERWRRFHRVLTDYFAEYNVQI